MASYTPVRIEYNKHEPLSCDDIKLSPVIFLHGLSLSKEQWANIPQIVANQTKRKVYVLDARNHGDSEWSNEWSFDINADDLFHFMDMVGEKKAILVGHSMGGITSMKAALSKPERIERIIVEDMHTKKFSPESRATLAAYLTYLQRVVQDIPPEMNEEEAKQFCQEQFFKVIPKEMKDFLEKQQKGVKFRLYFSLKRDSSGHYINKGNYDAIIEALTKPNEIQSELEGIYNNPAHFIYGALSAFNVLEDACNIKEYFPKAEFTGIQNATHHVHVDCPKEFTESLLKSLA